MAEPTAGSGSPGQGSPEEPLPLGQRLLDNVFLLLALGVLIPLVSYWLWGVLDILRVAPLR